jgi:hypothetical protein
MFGGTKFANGLKNGMVVASSINNCGIPKSSSVDQLLLQSLKNVRNWLHCFPPSIWDLIAAIPEMQIA